jgi:hypothetical protein
MSVETLVFFLGLSTILPWHLYSNDGFMGFNATFNNISAILWRSVLLVEETGLSGENHQPVASH